MVGVVDHDALHLVGAYGLDGGDAPVRLGGGRGTRSLAEHAVEPVSDLDGRQLDLAAELDEPGHLLGRQCHEPVVHAVPSTRRHACVSALYAELPNERGRAGPRESGGRPALAVSIGA